MTEATAAGLRMQGRILPVKYILSVRESQKVLELAWADLLRRKCINAHVEPGVFTFLAQLHVASNLTEDGNISLYDKMRLYDGEVVHNPRTGLKYSLSEVSQRAGQNEGVIGLGMRECTNVMAESAIQSADAVNKFVDVLHLVKNFAGGTAKGSGKLVVNMVSALNDTPSEARRPRKEVLDLLSIETAGDTDTGVDRLLKLLAPGEGTPNLCCISLRSVQQAMMDKVSKPVEALIYNPLEKFRRRALRDYFVRAVEPDYDKHCEAFCQAYLDAIHQSDVARNKGPLGTPRAREVESALNRRHGCGVERRPRVLAYIAAALTSGPRPPYVYTLLDDLRDAVENVVTTYIGDAVRLSVANSTPRITTTTISEQLIKQNGHCPLCAAGVIDSLANDDRALSDKYWDA